MRTVGLEYIQGHYWPYSFCGTKSIQEKKMDLGELATNFGPTSTNKTYNLGKYKKVSIKWKPVFEIT